MPHVQRAHRGRWHLGDPFPLGGRAAAALVVVLTIVILLLLFVKEANGNFVYWTNETQTSIGRAKINGVGPNNSFITGLNDPLGVAVDSKFIYWAERGADRIGRANLDGSGVNADFITSASGVSNPAGVAVTPTHIYWANDPPNTIGRANLDGSGPVANFITAPDANCGIAVDANFVYWTDTIASNRIGRAPLDGSASDPNFITGISVECGVAVDSSFIYWGTESPSRSIGRATIGGGGASNGFIPDVVPSGVPCGVAVNPQYIFWGNPTVTAIGRANINGTSPNSTLVPGASIPCLLAAAPSNKVTINSITRKKKKGTAIINAKVPGPGQVSITNTGTEDVAATAIVKQVGLTITGASSFKLPIKPVGKTKKKLNKQVKKKGKGKVKVKAFVTFVPAGVAGVPNSQPVKTKLIKQRKRKGKK
ncbi:MAG: hypothetical protein ACRDK5_00345 [Solirubrobacterales bacterium]